MQENQPTNYSEIVEFLKKNNLHKTANTLEQELSGV